MIRISFLGDTSLNNDYNVLYEKGENPFEQISPELEKSDFVISNIECFAKGEKGENINKIHRLKSNIKTFNYLKNINLSLVTTANNHIYDNLEDGYKRTIDFFNINKIDYIGSGYSKKKASREKVINIKGKKFCFLNYVTEDTNPMIPDNANIKVNYFDEYKVKKDIRRNKDSDFIIILVHWGGRFEGCSYPDPKLKPLGQNLIDAGANLIIGHHSHTFQPFEIYKGKYIFYSLGNFCFSDIISDNKKYPLRKKNRESAILHVEFEGKSYKPQILTIYNNDCFIISYEKNRNKIKRKQLFYEIFSKFKLIWEIYVKYLNIFEPLIYQIIRKDENRSLYQRLKGLSFSKIKVFLKK